MRYEDVDATVVEVNAQWKTCRHTSTFIQSNLNRWKEERGAILRFVNSLRETQSVYRSLEVLHM